MDTFVAWIFILQIFGVSTNIGVVADFFSFGTVGLPATLYTHHVRAYVYVYDLVARAVYPSRCGICVKRNQITGETFFSPFLCFLRLCECLCICISFERFCWRRVTAILAFLIISQFYHFAFVLDKAMVCLG